MHEVTITTAILLTALSCIWAMACVAGLVHVPKNDTGFLIASLPFCISVLICMGIITVGSLTDPT